jgi:hypothetical protein
MTFDKRGYVRAYVIPANPQSTEQGNARQKLAAVQAVLKLLITTAVDAIKLVAPTAYRWNSHAVKLAIGTGAAAYDAALVVFLALGAPDQAFWNTAFADVLVPDIAYKDDPDVTGGAAAFVVAVSLFDAGIITSPGDPGAANYAAWATALIP